MQKQPRVLLVDDEASVRRQLHVGLFQRGFEVEGVEDGLSALKKIETAQRNKNPFNFIVTDIKLPDINGLKLLQVIKSKYPDLPVVVISGYGDEHTKENVEESFGNAYLDKPFEVDRLEAEFKKIGIPLEEEPGKSPAAEERRMLSSYVFLRGKSDTDLYDVFSKLYFADGVLYCDAVRGEGSGCDWDMVLLIQAPDRKGIEKLVKDKILSLDGVAEAELHHAERPWLGEDLESFIQDYERNYAMERGGKEVSDKRNRRRVSAYALVEIDRSHLTPLYSKFYFTDNIVYCDSTDDNNMIILLLQAQDFDQIRRTIANEIRTQPGVLRVKTMNIMQVMAM